MGSILLAAVPSKSSKNISRIPNPFPLPRHAMSTLTPSKCSPIYQKEEKKIKEMGENLFPFFLEGAFLRDSQNNGCATTAERAIGGGSQSVEWKPAVCATSCIHDSSKKLRGVGGGGGSNRKAGLGRNLFQIRASGSPRTRRKTRRFFFFLLLRVLDPVLFQCQSHDFPINLSLVLRFFFLPFLLPKQCSSARTELPLKSKCCLERIATQELFLLPLGAP